jgi:type IV secretory pathway TraG/TraD family ATPase VirD4
MINTFLLKLITNPLFYLPCLIILGLILLIKIIIRIIDEYECKNTVHKIKITFPSITEEENRLYTPKIKEILDSSWLLLKGSKMSLEIHQRGGIISLLVTSNSIIGIEELKKSFTTIPRLTISKIDQDPMDIFKDKKIWTRRLVTTNTYYPLGVEFSEPFKNIVEYLSNLEINTNSSVIICMRPVDVATQIQNIINKISTPKQGEMTSLSSRYRGEEYIKRLNNGNFFLTEIYTISDQFGVSNTLASKFECMRTHFNNFVSYPFSGLHLLLKFKTNQFKWIKSRFVPRELIFLTKFRNFFGSFLVSGEIAQMFTPIYSTSGAFDLNKSIIIEAPNNFTIKESEYDILVGTSTKPTGERKNVYMSKDSNRRHKYVVGTTGSGKSTMLIREALSFAELAQKDELALIFFDPHAVDLKKVALRLKTLDKVVYFDPSLENSNNIITFNPLIGSFKRSIVEKDSLSDDLLDLIYSQAREKKQELGTTTQTLLIFLIKTGVHFADAYYNYLTVKHKKQHDVAMDMVRDRQLTIPDLADLLNTSTPTKWMEFLQLVFKEYDGSEVLLEWHDIAKYLKEQAVSTIILQAVRNRLIDFTGDSTKPLLSANSFNVARLVEEKKIILIPITNQSVGSITKKLLTKMISIQIWSAIQRNFDKSEPYKCHMIIDEVQEAINPVIPKILSEARKFGLSVTLANQFLSQLVKDGDSTFLDSILGNVGIINTFKMQNAREVETIASSFGGAITVRDIVSLPSFKGYIKATKGLDQKVFSIETIDYKSEYPELRTDEDLEQLSKECLDKYGIPRDEIKKKNRKKKHDPKMYFLLDKSKFDIWLNKPIIQDKTLPLG